MTKLDILVIIFILCFSIAGIAWMKHMNSRQDPVGLKALVFQADQLIEEVDLKKDGTLALLNGKMLLDETDGSIRVKKSNCPHGACVRMGWIRHGGQQIICVPNKVIIEIESEASPFLDAVCG
jgi:hypothetical protein